MYPFPFLWFQSTFPCSFLDFIFILLFLLSLPPFPHFLPLSLSPFSVLSIFLLPLLPSLPLHVPFAPNLIFLSFFLVISKGVVLLGLAPALCPRLIAYAFVPRLCDCIKWQGLHQLKDFAVSHDNLHLKNYYTAVKTDRNLQYKMFTC